MTNSKTNESLLDGPGSPDDLPRRCTTAIPTARTGDPCVPCRTVRLRFVAKNAGHLPANTAPVWRSVFGMLLRQEVCRTGAPDCGGCPLKQDCLYGYVFETPPASGATRFRNVLKGPSPIAIQAPCNSGRWISTGDPLDVELKLFGRMRDFEAETAELMKLVGATGLGHDGHHQVMFNLEHAIAFDDGPAQTVEQIPPADVLRRLRVRFTSPMCLEENKQALRPSRITFEAFFTRLVRRVSMLMYFHTDRELDVDFAALKHTALQIPPKAHHLYWKSDYRWSARQGRKVPLRGVLGELECDISGAPMLYHYLVAGLYTGVGKDVVMGLGRYVLA